MIARDSTSPLDGLAIKPQYPWADREAIAISGGVLLLASAFGNGLNYLFGIFIARWLGPESFGIYGLGLTIFNILSLTVVFGMDVGVIKFASHYLGAGIPSKAKETVVAALAITCGAGLVTAAVLAWLADPLASSIYQKPELAIPLLFFAAAIPFSTVGNVALSATQAFQTVRYTACIKYGWEPVTKFMLAASLLWAGFQLTGVLAAVFIAVALSATLFLRALYKLTASQKNSLTWNQHEAKCLIAFCLPLIVSNLFGVVAPRTDVLILGYWANVHEVGLYLSAFQTAAIMSLILSSFGAGFAPIISQAWSLRDTERMNASYKSVSRLSFTIALPIFCFFLLFAAPTLEVFGPEFSKGTTALMILAIGQLFNSVTGSANTMLLMSGHSKLVMTNTIVMGILLLLATSLMIPLWGIAGAAVAASGTFVATNMIRVTQVWRIHRVHPYTWDLAKPIVAAAASTGIVFLLQQSFPIDMSLLYGLALGSCYLAGLWLFGIGREDCAVLSALLSRVNTSTR
jgi:O-antigen/teichoic acid export membrane protein